MNNEETIKSIKNTKKKKFWKNNEKISFFENFSNESVTFADLISHSIINYGLINKFINLKVSIVFILII